MSPPPGAGLSPPLEMRAEVPRAAPVAPAPNELPAVSVFTEVVATVLVEAVAARPAPWTPPDSATSAPAPVDSDEEMAAARRAVQYSLFDPQIEAPIAAVSDVARAPAFPAIPPASPPPPAVAVEPVAPAPAAVVPFPVAAPAPEPPFVDDVIFTDDLIDVSGASELAHESAHENAHENGAPAAVEPPPASRAPAEPARSDDVVFVDDAIFIDDAVGGFVVPDVEME
jgi:hypothetical protein